MAFVAQDPNQPQQQQQSQAPQAPGAQTPVTTSSAPGAGPAAPGSNTGGSGGQANNQVAPQPFTNLQSYLTANAPQVTQTAQNITGQANAQYGQIQGDIAKGTQDFQNSVNAGYAAPDAALVSRAAANPVDVANSPTDVAAFQKQLNDSYTGPTSFETSTPYANLNQEVTTAANNAQLLNTPAGIQTYFGGLGNNSTQGDNVLDQVLLSGSPDALNTVQTAVKPLTDLPSYLSNIVPQQNAAVNTAKQQAQQAQTAASGTVNTAATNLTNDVQTALTAAQSRYGQNGVFQAIQAAIDNGQSITPEQAQTIGIDPAAYQSQLALAQQVSSLYNNFKPSLADYFTPGGIITTPPSAANVATPQQYAEAAALATLTGGNAPNLPINAGTANQAGTFSANASAPVLDLGKAKGDIKSLFSADDKNAVQNWLAHNQTNGSVSVGKDPVGALWANMPQTIRDAIDRNKASGADDFNLFNPYISDADGSNPNIYG